MVLHPYKLKCSLHTLLESFSGDRKVIAWAQIAALFLSQLGHSWLLCSLGARRCLYMGKISLRSTKQLPWIFTMLERECFMLILKRLQRYLERFEGRSTELYPLSEEGKRNRDAAAARICEAQMTLELDKVRLYGQTLPSCGSLIYSHVSS